jgi:tetratricopeptide (TPR) repeat protein
MPDVLLDHAITEYRRTPSALGLHDLLRALIAACHAVERDHRKGTYHRRLTPWSIVVGDLGTTTHVSPETPDEPVETTAYLAPELVLNAGDPSGPSTDVYAITRQRAMTPTPTVEPSVPATDVYALGAILYRILTGQAPYVGTSREEILGRIRAGAPWPPSLAAPGVPFGLEAICLTAMEREPRERYDSVAELARDLERYLAGVPLKAHYEEPSFARLRRRLKGTLGLVVLGILLGAALLALAVSINVIRTERRQTKQLQGEFEAQERVATAELSRAKVYADQLNQRHNADSGEEAQTLLALKAIVLKSQLQESDSTTVQHQKEELRRTTIEGLSPLVRRPMPLAGDEAALRNRLALAELFLLLGEPRVASYLYSLSAQAIGQRGPDEHPANASNPVAEGDLLTAQKGRGLAEARLGNLESARESFRQALVLAESLAKANPNYLPLRQEISGLHEIIGELSLQLFDLRAARESFEKLQATVEGHPQAERATPGVKLDQGVAYGRLAEVAFAEHRYSEALSCCRRSLELLQPLEKDGVLKDRPKQRGYLRSVEEMAKQCEIVQKAIDDLGFALSLPLNEVPIVLARRGEALARARKTTEAIETAERLRKRDPHDGTTLYNVACILALSGATRLALDALREAIDHGFLNGTHLKRDPDLESLRGEEEYQRLLKRLEMWRMLRSIPII